MIERILSDTAEHHSYVPELIVQDEFCPQRNSVSVGKNGLGSNIPAIPLYICLIYLTWKA